MDKRKQLEQQLKEARQQEDQARAIINSVASPFECCDNYDCDCPPRMEPSEADARSYARLEINLIYWGEEVVALEEELSKLPILLP